MLVITTIVDAPEEAAQAVKEQLCMCLEEFEDIKKIEVTQITSGGMEHHSGRNVILTGSKVSGSPAR